MHVCHSSVCYIDFPLKVGILAHTTYNSRLLPMHILFTIIAAFVLYLSSITLLLSSPSLQLATIYSHLMDSSSCKGRYM